MSPRKLTKTLCSALSLVLVFGCSGTYAPHVDAVQVDAFDPSLYRSDNTVILGSVMGGKFSYEGSRIDAITMRAAIEAAIRNSGVLRLDFEQEQADYVLNAMILYQKVRNAGFSMKAELITKYSLLRVSDSLGVWEKILPSHYTATFTSSCIGAARARKANEGAIRENVKLLVNEIAALRLE